MACGRERFPNDSSPAYPMRTKRIPGALVPPPHALDPGWPAGARGSSTTHCHHPQRGRSLRQDVCEHTYIALLELVTTLSGGSSSLEFCLVCWSKGNYRIEAKGQGSGSRLAYAVRTKHVLVSCCWFPPPPPTHTHPVLC